MTGEFLLEIGTEEIPARFLPPTAETMKTSMADRLEAEHLSFDGIRAMATPRRLMLVVSGLLLRQKDREQQVIGPPERAAFDQTGSPTKAAHGFARAHSIDVTDLKLVDTGRGKCLALTKNIPGKPTFDILKDLLPGWIANIPFPKSMRWASVPIPFARPIHWFLALLEGEIIPFELDAVISGNATCGHRFLAPDPVVVKDYADYLQRLRNAHVIIDPEERKNLMLAEIRRVAQERGGAILDDPELVTENSFLVEYPSVVCGSFDESFLKLPDEVLITAMREHQRYFAVKDPSGKLLPLFVAVNNTRARNEDVVTKGHQRVLKARLEDARFYFEDDCKKRMDDFVEELRGVLFQQKLGTSYQKMKRFRELACFMAETAAPQEVAVVDRAAFLCKADLVSGMVGQFPSLQGVMGRVYARLAGEPEGVAEAIFEHYLPRFAGDRLPSSQVGALVGMADRMDTICGCFGIGLIPTGAADPYALRRHTLAIINILLDRSYSFDLKSMANKSLELLGHRLEGDPGDILNKILEFFRTRFHNLLTGKGHPFDVVDAVLSLHFQRPPEALKRVEALNDWRTRDEFEPLAISFKRVVNILRDQKLTEQVNTALFEDTAEKDLWEAYLKAKLAVDQLLDKGEYKQSLDIIFGLKGTIDRFFDTVLVMVDNEQLRYNRLNLLNQLSDLFKHIGDFSRFSV
ncbi:MAG: glycine--tRNA ligase subunit beta [Deltaproteobacteria bacterium]|nr:glycine--tRNA ligase subunit beta [Deltaproteobacteria bacterium]